MAREDKQMTDLTQAYAAWLCATMSRYDGSDCYV